MNINSDPEIGDDVVLFFTADILWEHLKTKEWFPDFLPDSWLDLPAPCKDQLMVIVEKLLKGNEDDCAQ